MGNLTFKDHTGERFGDLIVLERSGSSGQAVLWLCRCDCGTELVVPSNRLVTNNTKSCGCRRTRSRGGVRRSPNYRRWINMKQRCFNPNNPRWADYGGRGVTVCQQWVESFETFHADVGDAPEGASLDRIDNDGNYEPGNVRWASRSEQQTNRRPKTST